MGRIILDTKLPSDLPDEATAATSSDWLVIQKSGETKLRKMRPAVVGPTLPANLANTATAATDSDWTTIQKFGETFLSRIQAQNAVPPLPASRIASGVLDADRIPNLDAAKVTSGTFGAGRIPFLDASRIDSGVFDYARLPAAIEVGTAATATSASLTNSLTDQVSTTVTATASTKVLILVMFEASASRSSGTGQYGVQVVVRQGTTTISPVLYAGYASGNAGSGALTIGGNVIWWDVRTITATTTFTVRASYISGSTSGARNNARIQAFKLFMA
jgi:hypothetical protein